ncbi:MAG: prephenate dehydrogenase [Ignavibacteriales bacterium]|nr:prephenate dehydrogenase [Ignavibacteriales bacterium]
MTNIALIGYGRFGRLVGHYLKLYGKVFVFDSNPKMKLEKGLRQGTDEHLKICKIVIIAVPINQLEKLLIKKSNKFDQKAIVVELCSVKEKPAEWMKKYLSPSNEIIGIHPLFGPDSVGSSLAGAECIICPIRISNYTHRTILNILRSIGIVVSEMTSRQHDKLMAETLFITQYIGRALKIFEINKELPRTNNFKKLEDIIKASNNDNIELFKDIYRYNRYAKGMPSKIKKFFRNLDKILI